MECVDVKIDKAWIEKEVEQTNDNSEDTIYMDQEEITKKEEHEKEEQSSSKITFKFV